MKNRSFPTLARFARTTVRAFSACVLIAALLLSACARPAAPTGPALVPDETPDTIETATTAAEPTPLPTPTPEPEPVMDFLPEEGMPEDGVILPLGEAYALNGTVQANLPLETVTVSIVCARNSQPLYPYKKSVRVSDGMAYRLDEPGASGASLAERVDFSELTVGDHTLTLSAACKGHGEKTLLTWHFYVAGPDWEELTEANFPDSYPEALAFFGSEDRFLYRYQWVDDRYILADPAWEKEYVTTMPGLPEGESYRVHVDAVPYIEKALEYLNTSLVRVHGTNGDTGILRASDLISTYNGCYVSRFTSSLKWVSHHAFGTAIDLNARMEPNKNTAENKELIQGEVREHLSYNGLMEEDGLVYYDFSYDGDYASERNGVPQTCVNYLLYELGFYRAGFGWAHYYKASSDGMHFCLSEFITYDHDEGEMALRKVFDYAEPQTLPEGYEAKRIVPDVTPGDNPTPVPGGKEKGKKKP